MIGSRFWTIALLACCLVGCSHVASAQTAAAAAKTGRYQLLQSHDELYMIDSETGRVWRELIVKPNEQQIARYVERLVAEEETARGLPFALFEKNQRRAALREEHKADIATSVNPCRGLTLCFVEVDRVGLKQDGSLASEIVK